MPLSRPSWENFEAIAVGNISVLRYSQAGPPGAWAIHVVKGRRLGPLQRVRSEANQSETLDDIENLASTSPRCGSRSSDFIVEKHDGRDIRCS